MHKQKHLLLLVCGQAFSIFSPMSHPCDTTPRLPSPHGCSFAQEDIGCSFSKCLNSLRSCCTLPLISKHIPLLRPLPDRLFLWGFSLGPGSMKIGCTWRVGFGLTRLASLSSVGRKMLSPDSTSETSSWFSNTYASTFQKSIQMLLLAASMHNWRKEKEKECFAPLLTT